MWWFCIYVSLYVLLSNKFVVNLKLYYWIVCKKYVLLKGHTNVTLKVFYVLGLQIGKPALRCDGHIFYCRHLDRTTKKWYCRFRNSLNCNAFVITIDDTIVASDTDHTHTNDVGDTLHIFEVHNSVEQSDGTDGFLWKNTFFLFHRISRRFSPEYKR